jgi:hypothetical protein
MRKTECIHYDRCLSAAAMSERRFRCDGCGDYKQDKLPEQLDMEKYWLLLWAVFKPDLYALYRRKQEGYT